MSLSREMRQAAQGVWSHTELERLLRNELAPLISFLEESETVDNGYPDAYPEELEKGDVYQGADLSHDSHGYTLEHNIDFHELPESNMGREGQGRFLNLSIWAKEHHWLNNDANLVQVSLFETGKIIISSTYRHDDINHEYNVASDIEIIMERAIHGYARNSQNVERLRALAEIASEEYNQHFATKDMQPRIEGTDLTHFRC
jgi:hypothetical protein